MSDPMTTETAEMFMRQRDEALVDWGRAYNALLVAVEAWEAEFGANEPPEWVTGARSVLLEAIGTPDSRDLARGQVLAERLGW